MATTALVVGAGASVAGAAASGGAFSSGKGGGGIDIPERQLFEKILNRGTADILDNQRGVVADALMQGNLLQPELFRALGFEPVFDTAQRGDIQAAGARFDEAQANFNQLKRDLEGKRGKGNKRGRGKVRRAKNKAQREMANAERELRQLQTVPPRITGISPIEGGAPDPVGSGNDDNLFRQALDVQNQTLLRALRGEEPIDATLRSSFEERRRTLRERLRRQMGPDFESSSAGIEALANFDREESEAFTQFNRRTIETFSALAENRATSISGLTDSRLAQLSLPPNLQLERGLALGSQTDSRNAFVEQQRREREFQLQGTVADQNSRDAADARHAAALGGGLSSLGGALTSAGQGSGLTNAFNKARGAVGGAAKTGASKLNQLIRGRELPGPTQGGGALRGGGLAGLLRG